MSTKNEKLSCVVCHAYLFEDDDVVYCPICGAPHHRDCYESIGHCVLEEYHGTDKEYAKPVIEQSSVEEKIEENDLKTCFFCKKEIEKDAKICPYCGRPAVRGAHFTIDLSGGVSDKEELDEGVTVKQVKPLVAVNTQRYLPKFLNFKKGGKASWNWLAFLFPQGWFFSRKMYKLGTLVTTALLAFQICLFPIISVLAQVELTDNNEVVMYLTNYFYDSLAKGNFWPFLAVMIGGLGPIAVRIFSGIFADRAYYSHIISRAKSRNESPLSDEEFYHKFGGVSIFAFLLGVMALNYLPSLLFNLLQTF